MVTVSLAAPTSSATIMLDGVPTATLISVTLAVLKPCCETVAVYIPAKRDGILKVPSPFVWAVNSCFVSLLTKVTVAPAITAPFGSVTVPVSDPDDVACPKTGRPTNARTTRTKKNFESRFLIGLLREWLILQNQRPLVKQQ